MSLSKIADQVFARISGKAVPELDALLGKDTDHGKYFEQYLQSCFNSSIDSLPKGCSLHYGWHCFDRDEQTNHEYDIMLCETSSDGMNIVNAVAEDKVRNIKGIFSAYDKYINLVKKDFGYTYNSTNKSMFSSIYYPSNTPYYAFIKLKNNSLQTLQDFQRDYMLRVCQLYLQTIRNYKTFYESSPADWPFDEVNSILDKIHFVFVLVKSDLKIHTEKNHKNTLVKNRTHKMLSKTPRTPKLMRQLIDILKQKDDVIILNGNALIRRFIEKIHYNQTLIENVKLTCLTTGISSVDHLESILPQSDSKLFQYLMHVEGEEKKINALGKTIVYEMFALMIRTYGRWDNIDKIELYCKQIIESYHIAVKKLNSSIEKNHFQQEKTKKSAPPEKIPEIEENFQNRVTKYVWIRDHITSAIISQDAKIIKMKLLSLAIEDVTYLYQEIFVKTGMDYTQIFVAKEPKGQENPDELKIRTKRRKTRHWTDE